MTRHLTENQICRAIAGQSTLDEHRHAHECRECRAEIEQAWQLLGAFRNGVAGKAEDDGRQAAAHRWHDGGSRRPSGLGSGWGFSTTGRAWALSAAALLTMTLALVWPLGSKDRTDRDAAPRSAHVVRPADQRNDVTNETDAGDQFYPLAYSSVPVTNGRLVRIEVPRSAPVAFGVDPISLVSSRRGAVLADVVVGEDGLARAVRFVRHAAEAHTLSKE